MSRRFIDTTVLTYAYGRAHPVQESCRWVLAQAAIGVDELHASVEAVQEFLFHRMRRTSRTQALVDADDARQLCVLHPFDVGVLERSLGLVAESAIRGRDAVHAGTALSFGFDEIVTVDTDFDPIPGLRRVDPQDLQSGR